MPDVYRALLESERERYERYGELVVLGGREVRVVRADPNDRAAGFFCRDDRLLKLLEASRPVVVRRAAVELALWEWLRPTRRVRLPFDRAVRFVEVSPDDRIIPAADLDQDGPVAEGS